MGGDVRLLVLGHDVGGALVAGVMVAPQVDGLHWLLVADGAIRLLHPQ